jgi:hypothetical protein
VHHCSWRLLVLPAAVLSGLAVLVAPSALAQPAPPPPPPNVHIVAGNLANPRGFTWGPDGALYVTESGTPPPGFQPPPGPPMPGGPPVINNNGRVLRIVPGAAPQVLADGLPVFIGPLGDTLGPASLAFIGNTLYLALAAGPKHGHPEMAGGIYRVDPGGGVTLIADTDAFNVANPPAMEFHDEAGDELSNPYDMIAVGGRLYVTDGNKDVIHVVDPAAPAGSRISRLLDFSAMGGPHLVLTGIARGPDGNLYVSTLTAFPFPTAAAQVFRITPGGAVTAAAAGISAGTGVAVAPNGTIYVTEIATTPEAPPFLAPPGRVVTATLDGTSPVASPLFFPTVLRWGPDGLYASINSVASNTTGAIARIDTPGVAPVQIP